MLTPVKIVRRIFIDVPNLGHKIREARKSSGRTVTDIAAEAEMSVQNWYRIENERQELPEETLRLIESALSIDFGVHFDEDQVRSD